MTSCVLEDKMQEILQKTDNMDKLYTRGKMKEILQKTELQQKSEQYKYIWTTNMFLMIRY